MSSGLLSKKRYSTKAQGYIAVLLSTLGFASFGVWAKMVGDTYEVFTQAWTRALIVIVVMLLVGILTRQLKMFEKKDLKWVIIYCTFSIFTVAPIYYAFMSLDVGTATVLFYASYIVTSYLVGRIFLGEKITFPKIVAILLMVVGMSMVVGVEFAGATALAITLAIINGIASGGEVSFTKKVSHKYSPLQLTLVSWVLIFITHLIVAAILGENLLPQQTIQSFVGILIFALTAMLAFWLVVAGYKRIEAGIGGLIGTLEVPFAVLLGVIIFNEQLSMQAVIGSLLIFVAAGLPDGINVIKQKLDVKS